MTVLVEPRGLRLETGKVLLSPRITVDRLTSALQIRIARPTTGGKVVMDPGSKLAVKLFMFVDGVMYKLGGFCSGGIREDQDGEIPEYVLEWAPPVLMGEKAREFMRTATRDAEGYYNDVPLSRLGETGTVIEAQVSVELRRGPAVQTQITLCATEEAEAPRVRTKNSAAFDAQSSAREVTGDGVLSVTHTNVGSTDLAALAFSGNSNFPGVPPDISSLTYGGVSMATSEWNETFFGDFSRSNGRSLAAPATGAQTVVCTLAASPTAQIIGVITATGVNQSDVCGTVATAGGNSDPVSVMVGSVGADDLVVDLAIADETTELTAGADQTRRWTQLMSAGSRMQCSTQAGSAGGLMTWTGIVLAADWKTWGIAFNTAAASAGILRQMLQHGLFIGASE